MQPVAEREGGPVILTAGEFLLGLKDAEASKLRDVGISHAPTIGKMYEGLSKDLLGRVIPGELGLQIVSGFVVDGFGGMSGQIDCMLVRGHGERVPHTDDFIWQVKDVIAVFEIKKTLKGEDLADAIAHLNRVRDLESNYFQSLRGSNRDAYTDAALESGYRAFAEMTGVVATYENEASLPFELRLIFHSVVLEPFKFIGVILGFHGFQTEKGFRKALVSELLGRLATRGYGPGSLPQLMISGDYSLCKANGQPFSIPLVDGKWPVCFSSAVNPLHLLLEYVWTRLGREFHVGGMWGNDLHIETPHPLLFAAPVQQDGRSGWTYEHLDLTESQLRALDDFDDWEPCQLTFEQAAVIKLLCDGGTVGTDTAEYTQMAATAGLSPGQITRSLVDTHLVAVADGELRLISQWCNLVTFRGQIFAADNNTGRLTRWLQQRVQGGGDAPPEAADT